MAWLRSRLRQEPSFKREPSGQQKVSGVPYFEHTFSNRKVEYSQVVAPGGPQRRGGQPRPRSRWVLNKSLLIVLCTHCLVPGTERELDADGWAVPEDPLHLGAPQPGQSSSVDSYQLITRPQSSSARGPTARHPSHQDSAPLHSRLQPELSLSLVQNNLSTPTSMRSS